MRFLGILITIFVLAQAALAEQTRIVLIPTTLDHPWATHMYGKGCEILAKCLNQNPDVEAIVSPDLDWPKDPSILEGADAIVYYSRPAGDILLAPERKEEVLNLLKKGVGYVAIHWSTATGDVKYGEEYLDILGGWFHFDHCGLKVETLPLIKMAPNHPVCRGWESYSVMDEFYLNLKFHEKTQPILKVEVDGTDQVVAWILEREDGGRSFGTTLAHFHSNFSIPAFRKAITNGILWSAKAEVPQEGSPIEIPEVVLSLPEEPPK
jgi:type 1 glutamine amidotransferase